MLANAASVHTRRWAAGLAGRGHDVQVVSIRGGDIPGVVVRSVWGDGPGGGVATFIAYLRLLRCARRLILDHGSDVVHAHYAVTHGVIAALRSPVPVVLTVWGSDVMAGDRPIRRPLRWAARLALRRAAAVTSSSEAMASVVERIAGVAPTVVRFGVDTSAFAGVTSRDAGPFTVGFLKGLRPKYAPDVLLDAVAAVRHEIPGVRLLVAGDGPLRAELERQTAALGLEEVVEFTGPVAPAEIPAFMSRIDVLANPSRSESFGVVLLEAAAAGRPVVATRVGGVVEAVVEGETALLVSPDDPDALAMALLALGRDASRRRRMGDAGRRLAARFEWDECVTAMERVLEAAA